MVGVGSSGERRVSDQRRSARCLQLGSARRLGFGRQLSGRLEPSHPGTRRRGSTPMGRFFGADGSLGGNEFQINEVTTGSQFDPRVSLNDDGAFVVAFVSSPSYQQYSEQGPEERTALESGDRGRPERGRLVAERRKQRQRSPRAGRDGGSEDRVDQRHRRGNDRLGHRRRIHRPSGRRLRHPRQLGLLRDDTGRYDSPMRRRRGLLFDLRLGSGRAAVSPLGRPPPGDS